MVPALPVENGSTDSDMAAEEESWEQKEEPGGGGGADTGGGGSGEQENVASGVAGREKPDEEMMEEEEEEIPMPKVASVPPNAPKKEHVNVVFIGHVGESPSSACCCFNRVKVSTIMFTCVCIHQMLGSQLLVDRSCKQWIDSC